MKKSIILFFISGLLFVGCTKYLDVNQNVNQPTTVTPSVVLSSALAGSAFNISSDYLSLPRWMCYWSRSGNYVPDVQTETYDIPNNYTDPEWTKIYQTLNSYNYIGTIAREQHLPFYEGVSKVMSAYHFSTLVDLYNNVPYTDAFHVATSVQPKYDNAQDIYNDLVAQIDSAVILFDLAKDFYATAAGVVVTTDDQYDIMFGNGGSGDVGTAQDRMDAWVRFANTLELKLLIHQSELTSQAGFIASQITKIDSNHRGFIGPDQSAIVNPGYQNSTGKISPLYGQFHTVTTTTTNENYYRAHQYAVDFYNSLSDNRISLFYGLVNGTVAGNFDGDPASVPNSETSAVGPGVLKGPSQNVMLLSDFESLFLQAEAVERGWITWLPQSAQELYESAITQSFTYMYRDGSNIVDPNNGDPVADATAYYTSGLANADWTASVPLEAILTQKWAALNGVNWVEAYTDFRRTGIPDLPISASTTHIEPEIPIRYLYPQSEYNTNSANTPSLPSNAQFTSKIFWDTN